MDRLPNELLSLIFSHLVPDSQLARFGYLPTGETRYSTLPNVCRVSSRWRAIGQECLFQRVELQTIVQVRQLALALEGRPELGNLVLGMYLWMRNMESAQVIKLCQNLRSLTVCSKNTLSDDKWIPFLPSTLVRLELQFSYFDEYETPLLPNLTFLHLENVSLFPRTMLPSTPFDELDRPLPPCPTLPPPNSFPCLRHLSIVDCSGYAPRLLHSPGLRSTLIEFLPQSTPDDMELWPILDEAFPKLDALVLSIRSRRTNEDKYAQIRHLLSSPKMLLCLSWAWSPLETPYADECFSDVQNIAIGLPYNLLRFDKALFSLDREDDLEKDGVAGRMARVANLTFLKEMRKIKLVILDPDLAEVNVKEVAKLRGRGVRVEVAGEDKVQERFAEIRRCEAKRARV